jgi:hypothetical protein
VILLPATTISELLGRSRGLTQAQIGIGEAARQTEEAAARSGKQARSGRSFVTRYALAEYSPNHIVRPRFGFFIDAPDVLSDDPEEEQIHSR